MKVSKLAYVGAHASDLDAWKKYSVEVLGLEIARDSSDKLLYLRADEQHHRLSIHPREANDIGYVGWEVADHEGLEAITSRLGRGRDGRTARACRAASAGARALHLPAYRRADGAHRRKRSRLQPTVHADSPADWISDR